MNEPKLSPSVHALVIVLLALASLYLMGLVWQLLIGLSDILLVFFLAWLLSILATPLVDWLAKWRLPVALAIALVYLGLTLLLVLLGLLLVPQVLTQLGELGRNLPRYVQELPGALDRFQGWLANQGVKVELLPSFSADALAQRAETLGTAIAQFTLVFLQGAFSAMLGIVIVVILSIYITGDRRRLAQRFLRFLPEQYRDEGRYFMERLEQTFGGYLRGMVVLALIYGIGNAVVMFLFGLEYGAPASLFAGLMMFIPFVGTFLAIIPPFLIALFTASLTQALIVLAILFGLQQVVLNAIAPRVLSQSVGIHPLLVFFALLLGIKVAGFWGALFGVPVVAAVYSMVVFFYEREQGGPSQPAAASKETEPAEQAAPRG